MQFLQENRLALFNLFGLSPDVFLKDAFEAQKSVHSSCKSSVEAALLKRAEVIQPDHLVPHDASVELLHLVHALPS